MPAKNHLHEVAFALAGAITLRLYDCSADNIF